MKNQIRFLLFALSVTLCASCSSQKDAYHVQDIRWKGDYILFRVAAKDGGSGVPSKLQLSCYSCNLIEPPQTVTFDPTGETEVLIPEAKNLLSARLHLDGSGTDTTFIVKQRTPQEATQFYHLAQPLMGRVLVTQFAMLYSDSTQNSISTNAQFGDELNIFSEDHFYYHVHHPLFPKPLFLLKSNATRLY